MGQAAVPAVAPAGHWRLAWRRLRGDRVGFGCLVLVAALSVLVFAGAPIAARLLHHGPNDPFPYAVDINEKPAGPWTRIPALNDLPPSEEYALEKPKPPKGTPNTILILGADGPLGRDEFLRLLYGGQDSLEVALGATLLALVLGIGLGALAGYFGGWIDAVVSRFVDVVMTFPLLLFLLMLGTTATPHLDQVTFAGVLNEGVFGLVVLIGLFTWFYPARIVRAEMLTLRGREFVEAAAMVGSGDLRIIRKHLIPHVAPALAAYGAVLVATNVMLEASMSFLGVGIKLPTASWGTLLTATWGSLLEPYHYTAAGFQPWLTILPSAAIFLTVLCFNLLGDSLRAALDPQRA
jgi:peptide/nickel transport system permease protein